MKKQIMNISEHNTPDPRPSTFHPLNGASWRIVIHVLCITFITVEHWSQDFEFSKIIANVNKETFGHSAFRPMQKEIINAVMHGKDCLVVMPTGAGKSLTFQVYTCFNVQLYFSLF